MISTISRAVTSLARSGFRWCVHTVRKMIIDLNPTATVGKCAGLFLYSLWRGELCEPSLPGGVIESLLGVAELRPPFLLGSRAISFHDSLLPAMQSKSRVNSTRLRPAK
jgi:hypothetical protein